MADGSQGSGDGAKATDDPRYTVAELQERRRILLPDVRSPHVIAGALAGARRQTHTVKQAEDAIKRFEKLATGPYDGAPEGSVPEDREETAA